MNSMLSSSGVRAGLGLRVGAAHRVLRLSCRAMSTAKALVFEKHGEPADALKYISQQVPDLKDTEVQIDIIAVSVS